MTVVNEIMPNLLHAREVLLSHELELDCLGPLIGLELYLIEKALRNGEGDVAARDLLRDYIEGILKEGSAVVLKPEESAMLEDYMFHWNRFALVTRQGWPVSAEASAIYREIIGPFQ